ncbi:MAG: response regulator [Verrucomicrobia bacterium]|nr:response regulator [Verrucomicrobiota bacterium]
MNKPRILVVEDEGIIAKDIQLTLEAMGYEVPATAATADEAFEKAAEFTPDLVLMDIVLPGGTDGVTAAERMRERLNIPVVYLTAHSDSATFQKAKLTEPYGYIVKPVVERELRIGIEMAMHRHRMDQHRAGLERWFAATLGCVGEAVIAADRQGHVRFMNTQAQELTGWSLVDAASRHIEEVMILSDEREPTGSVGLFSETLQKGLLVQWANNAWLYPRRGPSMPVDYTAARIRQDDGVVAGVVVIFRDITSRKQLEEERERLIGELRSALQNVKTLRGLLPVCASCKRIRDDDGYWEQVDTYLANHSLAQVSHGMCPDCLRTLYPDMAEEILSLTGKKNPEPLASPRVDAAGG